MDDPIPPPMVSSQLEAMQNGGIAALALDGRGCTLGWNQAFLKLFPEQDGAIHLGEAYAENLRRFYLARLDAAELPHIETYIADGVERHRRQVTPFEFEHRGQWLRVEVHALPGHAQMRCWSLARPPRDGEALAAGMLASGKRVPAQAIEQIGEGLILRDAQGVILLANHRFADTYGLDSPGLAIGKSFPELLHKAWGIPEAASPAAGEAVRRWADASRFPGAPFELPLPGDRWVRVREHRAHDGSIISTHVDVTDLYRLQRSAHEARQQAEELAALLSSQMAERKRTEAQMIQAARLVSLGEMATGLAHELNQPLTGMTLAADNAAFLLRSGRATAIADALELLEGIATASVRASRIVEHLRQFGRRQEEDETAVAINLRDVAEGALALTGAAIRSAGITLDISAGARVPRVMGRAISLEQLLINLLLNARDAILENERPDGIIHVALGEHEGEASMTVTDNGGGFSAMALQHGLEPFFTTKGPDRGTGLGLSLAYATIHAMGGRITLGNANGGAAIHILLPALPD